MSYALKKIQQGRGLRVGRGRCVCVCICILGEMAAPPRLESVSQSPSILIGGELANKQTRPDCRAGQRETSLQDLPRIMARESKPKQLQGFLLFFQGFLLLRKNLAGVQRRQLQPFGQREFVSSHLKEGICGLCGEGPSCPHLDQRCSESLSSFWKILALGS